MPGHRYKLLLAEPDGALRGSLSALFWEQGYQVLTADSRQQAAMMFASHMPDMVILETLLPDGDGLELIRQMREVGDIPVLVLSRRNTQQDIVCALDSGANDYLTKPFGTEELMARIRAALRSSRGKHTESGWQFRLRRLEIDYSRRQVTLGGKPLHLTQTEFNILAYLSQNAGRVLTYENIISYIWGGMDSGSVKKLQVNMANIRKKLGGEETGLIRNVASVGYEMSAE